MVKNKGNYEKWINFRMHSIKILYSSWWGTFFSMVEKIECIIEFRGVGNALFLHFISKKISDDNLLDLFGIFDRYKFDSNQLKVFMNKENKDWFD